MNKEKEILPEDYKKVQDSTMLIIREKFGIKRISNSHFVKHPRHDEIYAIGFGYGPKGFLNEKGFYAYWVWFRKEPYGGMVNCELKTKYDSIDYFQSCLQNAEDTIDEIMRREKEDIDLLMEKELSPKK